MPENRDEQARLKAELSELECPACGTVGDWDIYHTDKPIRWLRCRKCGHNDKIAVE